MTYSVHGISQLIKCVSTLPRIDKTMGNSATYRELIAAADWNG